MNLDEYIWREKKTSLEIANEIDVSPNTISNLKTRDHTPGLLSALKLMECAGGKINIEELLSDLDQEKYTGWLNERQSKKDYDKWVAEKVAKTV